MTDCFRAYIQATWHTWDRLTGSHKRTASFIIKISTEKKNQSSPNGTEQHLSLTSLDCRSIGFRHYSAEFESTPPRFRRPTENKGKEILGDLQQFATCSVSLSTNVRQHCLSVENDTLNPRVICLKRLGQATYDPRSMKELMERNNGNRF